MHKAFACAKIRNTMASHSIISLQHTRNVQRHVSKPFLLSVSSVLFVLMSVTACGRYPIPTVPEPRLASPPPDLTPQAVIVAELPTATATAKASAPPEPFSTLPTPADAASPTESFRPDRGFATQAPVSFLQQQITNLYDLSRLPILENTVATQYSSRNWTSLEHYFDYFPNDAAFTSPDYGYVNEDGTRLPYRMVTGYDGKPEYEIVPRVEGPGYISRIWFAYQQHKSINNPKDMSYDEEWTNWGNLGAMGNIRFYFDDEIVPRMDWGIKDLFVGRAPFPAPLAAFYASADGGNINYVPIPFNRSLRITTTGRPRGMQIEIKRLVTTPTPPFDDSGGGSGQTVSLSGLPDAATTIPVESFSPQLAAPEQQALDQATQVWQTCTPLQAEEFKTYSLAIPHNSSAAVDLPTPATISHLEVEIPKGMDDSVWMQVFWDGESEPSMTAPLRGMFGTAERLIPYRSLPLGIVATARHLVFYLHFPMPFQSARILFVNNRAETLPLTLRLATRDTVPGTEQLRLHAFYGSRRVERREDDGGDYTIIDVSGRGKYLGAILSAWELDRRSLNGPLDEHWRFPYLESNMDIWVDGRLALPGTGIEDDFDASYYYVFYGYPKYKTTYCLAGVTLLDYASHTEPSSQYRFYLNDAPEFRNRLQVQVQHGTKGNNLSITYSSTAFWYLEK